MFHCHGALPICDDASTRHLDPLPSVGPVRQRHKCGHLKSGGTSVFSLLATWHHPAEQRSAPMPRTRSIVSLAIAMLMAGTAAAYAADVTYERLRNPEPQNWLMN